MSGLHVYRSNRLELLAELLVHLVRETAPADPFQPVEVVVGSGGMARWVRHRLAEGVGVCANVALPFPTARLDRVLHTILGSEADGTDPWEPDALAWAVLEVLPGLVDREDFALVRSYLDRWDGPIGPKEWGLARQLADVFDRYVNYRPELARAWSRSEAPPLPADLADLSWQPVLFRAVAEHLAREGDAHPHRATRMAEAEARLAEPVDGLRGPLRFFGISSLPPAWMSLLGTLSHHIEIDLFLLTPSDQYWADVRKGVRGAAIHWRDLDRDVVGAHLRDDSGEARGNPLLASMGRVARDFQVVLESQPDDWEDRRIDLFVDHAEPFSDPADDPNPDAITALQWLQSDLLAARHPPTGLALASRVLAPGDYSLQIHSCYGPTRQVEVLRDLLLGLFDDHPDLEPRHVLVMTPDIEAYAPLVTAVFSEGARFRGSDWGPTGGPHIPFEVADLSVRRLNPVADALLRVLDAVEGRLEASSLLDLLAIEPVRDRFALTADDLVRVREWVTSSGIRWGRDAAHRRREGQPADAQNTWRFGLRRLLLGAVMADDGGMVEGTDAADQGTVVRPFDAMEGGDTAVLGRLVDFTNTLFERLDALSAARPLAAWVRELDATVDAMTLTRGDGAWLTVRVREILSALTDASEAASSGRDVSLDALRAALTGRFEVAGRITREQSGAVTFCSLQPMRSVPYRVVCLLGMDEDAFPRKGDGHAFDLTARAPRVGDRDARDEDRYLLLEALVATRDHLVVLYTGRDPHNNEARPPCVPIGELLDVVDQSVVLADGSRPVDALTTAHPLQAFSPSAFHPDHPWSFDRRLRDGAAARLGRAPAEPDFFPEPPSPAVLTPRVLPLDELIAFLGNPTRHLLGRRLSLRLDSGAEEVPDREPLQLDGLQRWALRTELLKGMLGGIDPTTSRRAARASGELPLGYAGRSVLDHAAVLVEQMLLSAGVVTGSGVAPPAAPIPVDLRLGSVRLVGSLDRVWDGRTLDFQFGKDAAKRYVGAWVRGLAWSACHDDAGHAEVVLGDLVKGLPQVTTVSLRSPADPAAHLEALVELLLQGEREPVPLFQHASWAFASATELPAEAFAAGWPDDPAAARDAHKALKKATGAWGPSQWARTDIDDAYVARVYRDTDPLDARFAHTALRVLGPLVRAMNGGAS